MMNIMHSISSIDISRVSGGRPRSNNSDGTPLLNGGGSIFDMIDTYHTFTYDDGSTITYNGRSEAIRSTETPISSVHLDAASCISFVSAVAQIAVSAGRSAGIAGAGAVGAVIACYNTSSVTR